MTVSEDSLSYHNGLKFVTFDKHPAGSQCASKIGGGWWYDDGKCAGTSNLNAVYNDDGSAKISWAGLVPGSAVDSVPKTTEMKIRPMNFSSNSLTH